MKRKLLLALAASLSLFSIGLAATPQDAGADEAARQEAQIADQLPSYPLETCVVSGEGLHDMGTPIDVLQDGKLVRLCCKGCKKGLAKDPAKIIAKIDAAVVAAQAPTYPLKTCVISGEPLGSMGDTISVVEGTRLIQLCCEGCKKGVAKDPAAALTKINAALIEQQSKSYPLDKCVVSGEPMEEPNSFIVGTQLVKTCCESCEKKVRKAPAKFLAKLKTPAKVERKSQG